jgi:hypothetical protein
MRSAALRTGLRRKEKVFFCFPGTYSSARKRALGNVPGYYRLVPGGTQSFRFKPTKQLGENACFLGPVLSRCPYSRLISK